MTKAAMALSELAEKGPDVDVLRQMIQFVAQRVMDLDVETLCASLGLAPRVIQSLIQLRD